MKYNKEKQIQSYLEKDEYRTFKKLAESLGHTVASYIRLLCQNAIKQNADRKK